MYDDNLINIYLNQKILPSKHIFIGGKYREFLQQSTEPAEYLFLQNIYLRYQTLER